MKLVELTVEGFRGVPDGTYAFADPATGKPLDLVLITGPASSGKTSLLGAVAAVKELAGGYGALVDQRRLRRSGAASGRLAATWQLSEDESSRHGKGSTCVTEVSLADGPTPLLDPAVSSLFSAYSPDPSSPKFELFPASRRVSLAPLGFGFRPSDLADARHRLSHDPAKYAGLGAALLELAARDGLDAAARLTSRGVVTRWEQPDSLAPIKRSLASLAPWLRLLGIEQRGGAPRVRFERSDGTSLDLDDLSEGELQALLFSVVFDRVGLRRSVILLDTPELHLHPDDHVRFLRALAALGADNQILAATTSTDLLSSVPSSQVLRVGRKR